MVYIDDYNSIEKLRVTNAQSVISTRKRKLNVLAKKSEDLFTRIQELASEIKMKVNERKTQMLCINASKNNTISSYIRTSSGKIQPTNKLKILGFTFDNNPNASCHVNGLI